MIRATCWIQASVIPVSIVSITPDGNTVVRSVCCFPTGGTREDILVEFSPFGVRQNISLGECGNIVEASFVIVVPEQIWLQILRQYVIKLLII